MKKIFVIFILLFSLVLSSCTLENEYSGDELMSRPELGKIDTEIDFSGDFIEQTVLDGIEDFDFNGDSFTIVTTDEKYLSSSDEATFLDKAITKRNTAIEKKFNIDIIVKVESKENLLNNIRQAAQNGQKYADLIVAPGDVLSTLMSEGLLANLNSIPYVDYSANYIDTALTEAAQINGKLYLLYGDFTQTKYSGWCVFYNEFLSKKIGIDPYELYKAGEWTKEAFLDFSQKATQYTQSGFVTTASETGLVNALWAAFGERFFGNCAYTSLNVPQVENAREIISEIKTVIQHDSYGKTSGSNAIKAFISGDSAMILCRREAAYQICESGIEWKAVPLPKRDSESDHKSYIDGEALAVSVPLNGIDTDYVGRILNALLAYTPETVSAGIENNELYYYWKDNHTALAMEETKKYGYLDIAIIYASAVKEIRDVTTNHIIQVLETGIKPFQFYHSTKNQFVSYAEKAFR